MTKLQISVLFLAIASSAAAADYPAFPPQPLPLPRERPYSLPFGYTRSGSFAIPNAGASFAVPAPHGTCPFGFLRSGFACLQSGR